MTAFSCFFWWFILGGLLGWLLNWLLSRLLRKSPPTNINGAHSTTHVVSTPSLQSTVVSTPATQTTHTVDLAAAGLAGYTMRHVDDLEVIDGIGPKIEALFRENGITTFAQVAKMSVRELQAILDKGGPNFKSANPKSWAQQARLIRENRWDDLKTLHAKLAVISKNSNSHKI